MGWSLQYGALTARGDVGEDGIVRLQLEGASDVWAARQSLREVEEAVRGSRCWAVLIDGSRLTRRMPQGELLMLSSLLPPVDPSNAPIFAFVDIEQHDADSHILEKALVLTGRLWTCFNSTESALVWLRLHGQMKEGATA